MKSILSTLFPDHSMGTAATISFFILIILILIGFTLSEALGEGTYTANYVALGAFTLIAGLLFVFDRIK